MSWRSRARSSRTSWTRGPGVEHRGQERIVPAPPARGPIDRREHRGQFAVLEVLDGAGARPLEGDAEEALGRLQVFGMLGGEEADEGMDGGEPDVPRRGGRVAVAFQVGEEGGDRLDAQIVDVAGLGGPVAVHRDKPQQQYQKALLRPEVQQQLSPPLRHLLALDDPLNDTLSTSAMPRSGFMK